VADRTTGVIDTTDDSDAVDRTSIQVSEELADELYSRKGRGESYEDVIWALIDAGDEGNAQDDVEERARAHESSAPRESPAESNGSDDTTTESQPDVVAEVVQERADAWRGKYPAPPRKLALSAVLNRVREESSVSVAELKAMEADHPVEGQSRENWWNETILKGLQEVAEYDQSERSYEWVGRGE